MNIRICDQLVFVCAFFLELHDIVITGSRSSSTDQKVCRCGMLCDWAGSHVGLLVTHPQYILVYICMRSRSLKLFKW